MDDYLEARREHLRKRSFEETERHLRDVWKPLHPYQLAEITNATIGEKLDTIAKERGPVAANRSRSSLSAFFVWAMKRGHIAANLVSATDKRKEASRDRVLSDEELGAIWLGCPESDYGRIVKLLMLTGQRREG